MTTPVEGFAGALNQPLFAPPTENFPLVQGIAVTPPEPPPPGLPTLAGWELWIPPRPNVFDDGMPVYEVSVSRLLIAFVVASRPHEESLT